jgi:hypothetical protein
LSPKRTRFSGRVATANIEARNTRSPADYAKLSDPAKQRDGSPELPWGSAPRPVASPSQQGSNDVRALLPTG